MRGGEVVQAFRPARIPTLCLLVAGVCSVAAQQPAAPPDTILVNGHVVTVDARFSIVTTSPGLRNSGGLRPAPTPSGVPLEITSPG